MWKNLGKIFREGMAGGLIAYLAVVVVLAILNAAEGRSVFHTAAAMGAVLFHGGDAASHFAVEPAPVLAYNGIHLAGSLAVGLVASFQIFETELHRAVWYFPFTVLIAAVMYSITIFGVFGVEIGGVIDWTTVVVGTAAWIVSMTGYFWWVHRGLMGRIQDDLEQEL